VNFYEEWVNDAYIQITTKNRFWGLKKDFDFPELHVSSTGTNTADGTAYINSTASVLYIEEVYDATSNVHLEWMPWSWYISKTDRSNTSAENNPEYWHRRGTVGTNDLFLYPTPDSSYSIIYDFRKRPPVITSAQATLIGAEWDEPILMLALIKGCQRMGMFEKAQHLKAEWIDMVSGMLGGKEELAKRGGIKPKYEWKGRPYG